MWTLFWDMHSGGGSKEPFEMLYIEASMEEAKIIFYNRFGHNPERVSCTCCGEDYSISEDQSLDQLTAFHRNCAYDSSLKRYVEKSNERYPGERLISIEEYLNQNDVMVIYSTDIKPEERIGEVPEQGYVWK